MTRMTTNLGCGHKLAFAHGANPAVSESNQEQRRFSIDMMWLGVKGPIFMVTGLPWKLYDSRKDSDWVKCSHRDRGLARQAQQ